MIGKKLNDALNDQIKNELESSYLYLAMTGYFESLSLDGMANWMRAQAHEEMTHAMKFFNHVLERGGKVELKDLKLLKSGWKSPLEAFRDAHKHEQFISGRIDALIGLARKEQEFASEPLLSWFVNEQVEEEANAGRIAEQLAMVGADKPGLLMIDRELGARPFPAASPFNPQAAAAAE